MATETTILAFLKFGNEAHIRDLYQNGTIFMNSIQYFKDFEDSNLRGDKYESVNEIRNYPSGSFVIPSISHTVNYQSIHINLSSISTVGNVYSLYCISSRISGKIPKFKIHSKMAHFGTHCLFVKNNPAFINLIIQALDKRNLKFQHGFVEYFDPYRGNFKKSVFQKPQEYSYQNEFRFYIERDNKEPYILQIGCLDSVAEVWETQKLIDGLRLK